MKGMDGIPNFWGERYDFSELPIWRKIVSVGAAVAALVIGATLGASLPSKTIEIYHDAPSAPVTATRQIYPVHVEGGYLRYVTKEQAEELDFLQRTTGPSIGASLVTAALVLLTYRGGREAAKKK
jgi:hypothetical protein